MNINAKPDAFLLGFPIYVNPLLDNVPRMRLSKEVCDIIAPYNPEFCSEINKWMKEFFGTENQVITMNPESPTAKKFIMGPKSYEQIMKQLNLSNLIST